MIDADLRRSGAEITARLGFVNWSPMWGWARPGACWGPEVSRAVGV
ncbi:MAG: hypothetical protein LC721_07615 [Actinobacteria bacterium]|nr:hypothetical protein [Actinomycetota bacterium]